MTFMSVMLKGAARFLDSRSNVLAGSSLLSAAQRKGNAFGRDLQGKFLLHRPGCALGSPLRTSTPEPVVPDLSRFVMAMIGHCSLVAEVEGPNRQQVFLADATPKVM